LRAALEHLAVQHFFHGLDARDWRAPIHRPDLSPYAACSLSAGIASARGQELPATTPTTYGREGAPVDA
jgi:hypothetical protein